MDEMDKMDELDACMRIICANIQNREQTVRYLKKILTDKQDIRLANPKIHSYIVNVPGALDFLKCAGYSREYYPSKSVGLESYFKLKENNTVNTALEVLQNVNYGNIIIKVKLPDGKVITGAFQNGEKLSDVIKFVENSTLYKQVLLCDAIQPNIELDTTSNLNKNKLFVLKREPVDSEMNDEIDNEIKKEMEKIQISIQNKKKERKKEEELRKITIEQFKIDRKAKKLFKNANDIN